MEKEKVKTCFSELHTLTVACYVMLGIGRRCRLDALQTVGLIGSWLAFLAGAVVLVKVMKTDDRKLKRRSAWHLAGLMLFALAFTVMYLIKD